MEPEQELPLYLRPPYRLVTMEDVQAAITMPPPGFTAAQMRRLASRARNLKPQAPPAMVVLPPKISLRLYRFRTRVARTPRPEVLSAAACALSHDVTALARYIGPVQEMASEPHLASFLQRALLEQNGSGMIHKELRDRLVALLHQGRYHLLVRSLGSYLRALCKHILKSGPGDGQVLAELRRLLLAYTLFAVENDDVLTALRRAMAEGSNSPMLRGAVAELILWRARQAVYLRILRPQIPIEAFVRKLDRLELTVYQRNALTTMVRRAAGPESIARSLGAAERAARLFRIAPRERTRLLGMLQNLRSELTKACDFYERYILEKDLVPLCRLYRPQVFSVPRDFMSVRRSLYLRERLDLYPTKDYLDLLKGKISEDCTSEPELARAQLAEPRFFNLRMFSGNEWVGNIYCLDFGDPWRALVIDRIQVPRRFSTLYEQFFARLARAFRRLLRGSTYRYVLVPRDISNHDHIRALLAAHVRATRPATLGLPASSQLAAAFESFKGSRPRFYVLVDLGRKQSSGHEHD